MTVDLRLGDCLELMRDLPDASVDAVITDPPFNVSVQNGSLVGIKIHGAGKNGGRRDFGAWDFDFEPGMILPEFNRTAKDAAQFYVFSGTPLLSSWVDGLWEFSSGVMVLEWIKPDPVPQIRQRHWCSAHENIVWAYRGKYTFNYMGHSAMYSWQLAQAPKVPSERVHPNQKPIDLIAKYIAVSTNEGDTVLDPFMGSGTTGVACVKLNRNFIGMEINPDYFKIAEKRIAEAQMQMVMPL